MADTPTWTYQIEYWMNLAPETTPAVWTFVDFDTSFNPSKDNTEYSPSYKARKVQPSWIVGTKISVDFDIDIVENATLQEWFKTNEDVMNAPCQIMRVWRTGSSPYNAKMANFTCNTNPLDGDAGAQAHATGTMVMIDDGWTIGTVTYDSDGDPTFQATGSVDDSQ